MGAGAESRMTNRQLANYTLLTLMAMMISCVVGADVQEHFDKKIFAEWEKVYNECEGRIAAKPDQAPSIKSISGTNLYQPCESDGDYTVCGPAQKELMKAHRVEHH